MAIDTTKDEYDRYAHIWQKCRDASEGQEQMHLQGEMYIPKLSGQDKHEYDAMIDRALYYNATARTIDAMSGLLFRKDPMLNVPATIEPYLDDIDLNGNDLTTFLECVADEVLTTGRTFILVEHPEVVIEDANSFTQADVEAENIRPFFALFTAESIINWRVERIQNQWIVTQVVLKEQREEIIDEFERYDVTMYRVLDLEPETGNYRQRLFEAEEDAENFQQIGEDIFPLKAGQPLKYIPGVFINSKTNRPDIEKPPLLDLVNVNISHYKTTADIEHAAHFTALPTAVVTGHTIPEGTSLRIGSTTAWVFSEPDADAKFLEFTGQGLEGLETRLEKKEQQMATLGARMLANEKASAETEESHKIKRQGENSALSSIARSIDSGIHRAFTIMADWLGLTDDIEFSTNKDFISSKMQAAELLALFQVYQGGGIAFSDFISNLQKGEVVDGEKTPEDIRQELEIDGPIGAEFVQDDITEE